MHAGKKKRNTERLLWRNVSSALPCHLSHFASLASRVHRRTHFALFRWAITQNSPLCWAQRRSRGSKNITLVMCDFLCHINGTSRYCTFVSKAIFQCGRGQDTNAYELCGWRFMLQVSSRCPRFPTPLQALLWWTERQLSVKELSKLLTLMDTFIHGRLVTSSDQRVSFIAPAFV